MNNDKSEMLKKELEKIKYAQYGHYNNFRNYLSHGCGFTRYKEMINRLYNRTTKKELDSRLESCIKQAKRILNSYLIE